MNVASESLSLADTAGESTSRRFIDNGDGAVTDTRTRLVWSKATLTSECVTHKQAEQACAELGDGWRLPTLQELFAIADHSRSEPAIDTDAFPDTHSDWYWTSTGCAWSSDLAWCVGFANGGVNNGHRDSNDAFARAVRSVPAGQ